MKMAYKEEGKWWVSPANYLPEVTKNYHFPEHIEILDTTLRDGEQEPGIIFTKEDKVAIAKRLDAAGVHRIEAGCPMTSEEDAAAIKEICALGLKAKIYCFVRGVMSDMDVAKACGVDGVVIEVPGSEQMLQGGMRWGMEKAIKAAVGKILEKVELFDVYKGEQIAAGKKSVAFNIILRAADRTLTDEEVASAMQKVTTALEELGAQQRA